MGTSQGVTPRAMSLISNAAGGLLVVTQVPIDGGGRNHTHTQGFRGARTPTARPSSSICASISAANSSARDGGPPKNLLTVGTALPSAAARAEVEIPARAARSANSLSLEASPAGEPPGVLWARPVLPREPSPERLARDLERPRQLGLDPEGLAEPADVLDEAGDGLPAWHADRRVETDASRPVASSVGSAAADRRSSGRPAESAGPWHRMMLSWPPWPHAPTPSSTGSTACWPLASHCLRSPDRPASRSPACTAGWQPGGRPHPSGCPSRSESMPRVDGGRMGPISLAGWRQPARKKSGEKSPVGLHGHSMMVYCGCRESIPA
jgi:hypothetical protein